MTVAAQILSSMLLGVSTVELTVEAVIAIYCITFGVRYLKNLLSH